MIVGLWGLRWLILLSALAFFISGCAAANAGRDSAAAPQPGRPADEIAALASENAAGSHSVNVSPCGGGTATLGEVYFSALGVACRRVIFMDYAGRRHDLAVCDESGGGLWSTAPDIFSYFSN